MRAAAPSTDPCRLQPRPRVPVAAVHELCSCHGARPRVPGAAEFWSPPFLPQDPPQIQSCHAACAHPREHLLCAPRSLTLAYSLGEFVPGDRAGQALEAIDRVWRTYGRFLVIGMLILWIPTSAVS